MALAAWLLATVVAACGLSGDDPPGPEITSQGFRMLEPQAGVLRGFGELKVRVEAPAGIEELVVTERSYQVDLAKSPELSHFTLFGLPRRVYSQSDVTLDFQNYINEKLDVEGRYEFVIAVTDRKGRSATTQLFVELQAEPQANEPAPEVSAAPRTPARRGDFRFQRVGRSRVQGADAFGITWKTIDSVRVVIEMTGSRDGASELATLSTSDYDAIETKEQLTRRIDASEASSSLTLATANNAAADKVFAVIAPDRGYVLRTHRSQTSLSDLGTTVTLTGEYKY